MIKFSIQAWHATHTSGTKFYQVLQIRMANGSVSLGSFALRQNGAVGVSNGAGKMMTGAVEGIEVKDMGGYAGVEKKNEKRAGGYTQNEKTTSLEFATIVALRKWITENIGPKGARYCKESIAQLKWADVVSTPSVPDPEPEPKAPREPDEPASKKHNDWGSW